MFVYCNMIYLKYRSKKKSVKPGDRTHALLALFPAASSADVIGLKFVQVAFVFVGVARVVVLWLAEVLCVVFAVR